MKEFCFGSDQQYAWLENLISDGQCHVFQCVLPACCAPDHCRLGFEKADAVYIAYIDKGIKTTAEEQSFLQFLQNGECKFTCIEDMASFFRSLQSLFGTHDEPSPAPKKQEKKPEEKPDTEVVDIEGLVTEWEQKTRPKIISPEAISAPLKQMVFGEDEAIDQLCELIALNRMRKTDKLLTVMLLGPTATGKSETAKSLAEVLTDVTGTKYDFIEVACSEFVSEHSVHRFLGAPPGYVGHGQPTVLEPVRKNPHHCIVLNEIEKSHPKLVETLMEALDTGILGMADNSKPIDLNQCILVFTSNLPISMKEYEAANDFQRAEMCRDAFTKHCGRPEISGKIGNFIVYRELPVEALVRITLKFIRLELRNYDLKLGSAEKPLIHYFLDCESDYGARAIAINVTSTVGKQLQRFLLNHSESSEALAGRTISLSGTIDSIQFNFV